MKAVKKTLVNVASFVGIVALIVIIALAFGAAEKRNFEIYQKKYGDDMTYSDYLWDSGK